MPVIEARARGSEWIVHLPGGRYIGRPSEAAVRRLVSREALGSAIAFLPALGALRAEVDRAAPPSGARPSRGARPERVPEASGHASASPLPPVVATPVAVMPPAPHRTPAARSGSGGPSDRAIPAAHPEESGAPEQLVLPAG
jgi:hypothetical protein